MARIFPFRALRYNPNRVRLSDVVTQPYDKITPEMQARYYAASPFNLVRIILGRAESGDTDTDNVYTRAARDFAAWRHDGILTQDPEPAIYAYTQRFASPQGAMYGKVNGGFIERRGFIALGQIESYDAGVVFRHEQTLSAPRTDRLNLLRATRAHFGQIFMVYSDPERRLETLLEHARPPKMEIRGVEIKEVEIKDEYGVEHRVRRIADPTVIEQVQQAMAEKKLIIADGHHRYETALAYRDEQREQALSSIAADMPGGGMGTGSFMWKPEWTAAERVMMTCISMESPGLVILPTHRVVFGLPNFDSADFIRRVREFFSCEQISGGEAEAGARLAEQRLAELRGREIALVAVTGSSAWLLRLLPERAAPLLDAVPAGQETLDVAVLHRVLLQHVLGLSEEDIREQKHLRYLRAADEATQRVRSGEANVAFLINPVTMEQVRDIAFAGGVLPQKSTDFYPKLLSGLTIYALDR